METNVESLVALAQKGNEEAFDELLSRFEPLMLKHVNSYHIPRIEKQDCMQEARLVLHQAVQKYTCGKGTSFASYYKRALVNRLRSILRKETAQKKIPLDMTYSKDKEEYFDEIYLADRWTYYSPEAELLLKEELARSYKKFSPYEQLVLYFLLRGRSVEEIAKYTQTSETQVLSAMNRTKRKIKRIFKEED